MKKSGADLRHVPELDGVRGIAVLAVMFFHFHSVFLNARPLGVLSDLIGRGFVGVDIFFVLSGFLITSILVSTRGASNYFSAFYARRSLRILPLTFVTIAVFYWLALPFAHRHGLLPKLPESEQIWYWLFLGNWRQGLGFNDGASLGHFWSLAIEEQFYIGFALLARFLSQRTLAVVSVGLLVLSLTLRVGIAARIDTQYPEISRLTIFNLDSLALGALLACSTGFLVWASRWRWPLMVLGFGALFLPLPKGMGTLACALGATGLVAMAATREVPFMKTTVLRSCGKYSFGMYVLHPFGVMAPLSKKYPHSTTLMLTALVLGPVVSYGIAFLSWNVLEKHFIRLKRYFPYFYAPVGAAPEEIVILPPA